MSDLLFAWRQLRKSPGFTFVAVLTLALGIGANTAIFSVVNAVLLKPLPFPDPQQLFAIGAADPRNPKTSGGLDSVSFPDFVDLRAQNHTFSHLALYHEKTFALTGSGEAQSVRGQRVSGEFFDVLGVKPVLGRSFSREDEVAGGGADGLIVILSHEFWERQFKRDNAVLGRVLMLDGQPHTVVGVMPPRFQFPIQMDPPAIYATTAAEAVSTDAGKPATEQRGNHKYQAVGRAKPGVTHEQARADLQAIAAALENEYPDTNTNTGVAVLPLRDDLVGDVSGALYVLFGAVACVLLIASANVANLLLARATVRAKEIALRSALGASRGRIVRQLLTESILLSALGGALGLMFAAWGTELLVRLIPQNIPRVSDIRLDPLVLAFTFAVAIATGVIFGVAPALHASRLDLRESLNDSGRTTGGARHTLRSGLVIAEVALALILLTGAGLLLQSFKRLSQVDPGLRTERLLTGGINLPDAGYPKPENVVAFFDEVLPRLRTLPGVQSVGTVFPLPLSGSNVTTSFDIEERPVPKGQEAETPMRIASADYFATVAIPLIRGRLFTAADQLTSKQVIIVNQAFADKFFPGEDPIGKRISPGWSVDPNEEDGPMREIIGIVGNVKHSSLRANFTPEAYAPLTQLPVGVATLVVRTSTSAPAALTSAVRAELARADAAIPLTRVRVFDEYVASSLARPRFNATLLSIFAGVALVLTAIGIYGVMAYSVAQRRQEIGIRMALGAQRGDVLRLVISAGMKLAIVGVVIGLAAAFGLTRLLTSLLYGITAFDPVTLGCVVVLLAGIALLACWVPARRASGLNPLVALREG